MEKTRKEGFFLLGNFSVEFLLLQYNVDIMRKGGKDKELS